ncbi:hypothetical protein GLOIN_2v1474651 [Rhizophagus irregularis DAOM 181602=DAOM 197198]|uniref:Heparan-alpha-glucosaminide N-acetyltransferase catalytic domain-containing protein n=1 Tax=Rhizophagus irregularis (strain DAOM 181602 / DAOM 197198 / MUCL 43194) TaxID=747089 RepID=A0A2P4QFR0_RHIID|nr:hypothetical protein GLOIN_2v1474651 [Rhizophagus irregularis DAOM 181602=DAOM 197198]POG76456.1 hypothetical protein GLOIN_2v1474651 [Rhizophagus irregularis DAOM 181602=DAOM 197198]|eukprot:XP_025183322.1 hypothetical protein GLOIN_2v1474651 [Rhizophagus irregularis DAOM 181602=DAOM 197198]
MVQPNERTILIQRNATSYTGDNTKPRRVVVLDVFRGLLMVLQSLDHARSFLTALTEHETWYSQPVYKDLVPSISRLVTHLAAPGFAFMMGFGIILFSESRLRIGWEINKLLKHYIIRGLTLLILNAYFMIFGIIYVIDSIGNVSQTPKSIEYETVDFGLWRFIWLLPGEYKWLFSMYPPLNWLSFTIFGILYGYITLKQAHNKRYNRNLNLKIGIFLLTLFLAIRIPGKFGNINPELLPSPPPGTLFNNPYLTSILQFVNAIKYPPDLSFITLYMGLNHLILAFFYSIPSSTPYSILNYFIDFLFSGPLLAFGQSALFFYMVHFHLYLIMGLILTFLFGSNQEPPYSIDSWQFWSMWIFGLALLWPMCIKYAKFKSRKEPDSLWRFF